jgi:hypothetical protein
MVRCIWIEALTVSWSFSVSLIARCPVPSPGHEQILGGESGDYRASRLGDHDLLLDPGRAPAVVRRPVGLQG